MYCTKREKCIEKKAMLPAFCSTRLPAVDYAIAASIASLKRFAMHGRMLHMWEGSVVVRVPLLRHTANANGSQLGPAMLGQQYGMVVG